MSTNNNNSFKQLFQNVTERKLIKSFIHTNRDANCVLVDNLNHEDIRFMYLPLEYVSSKTNGKYKSLNKALGFYARKDLVAVDLFDENGNLSAFFVDCLRSNKDEFIDTVQQEIIGVTLTKMMKKDTTDPVRQLFTQNLASLAPIHSLFSSRLAISVASFWTKECEQDKMPDFALLYKAYGIGDRKQEQQNKVSYYSVNELTTTAKLNFDNKLEKTYFPKQNLKWVKQEYCDAEQEYKEHEETLHAEEVNKHNLTDDKTK